MLNLYHLPKMLMTTLKESCTINPILQSSSTEMLSDFLKVTESACGEGTCIRLFPVYWVLTVSQQERNPVGAKVNSLGPNLQEVSASREGAGRGRERRVNK